MNDCFRPVSRYFDRITRPEQLLVSLPRRCACCSIRRTAAPVTLALPQDVQTEVYDYPAEFFRRRVHRIRQAFTGCGRSRSGFVQTLQEIKKPWSSRAAGSSTRWRKSGLPRFADEHGIPVAETQAGKGSLAWDHPCNVGAIGVTGTQAANALAARADLVLAIGTRLGDFATGSRALFPAAKLVQLNVGRLRRGKHGALSLVADADAGLEALGERSEAGARRRRGPRKPRALRAGTARSSALPHPKEAREADRCPGPRLVNKSIPKKAVVVCAAGGLPGELHKLWRATDSTSYHLEYGYSCMGYEIAGGLGVKLAHPNREVCVLVGDGSYLMLNSEIATSVALGAKLVIVVLDNRGFGCIERLQAATGGASFNNLLGAETPRVDFRSACPQPRGGGREGSRYQESHWRLAARPAGTQDLGDRDRNRPAPRHRRRRRVVGCRGHRGAANCRAKKARSAYERARKRQGLGA